jgi:hypothetical protein
MSRPAASHGRRDYGDNRPAENIEGEQRAEVGQRKHRTDRQIDAADNDDERLAKRDKADFARLPRRVGEARRG